MILKTVKTASLSLQIKVNYDYLHAIMRVRRQQKTI